MRTSDWQPPSGMLRNQAGARNDPFDRDPVESITQRTQDIDLYLRLRRKTDMTGFTNDGIKQSISAQQTYGAEARARAQHAHRKIAVRQVLRIVRIRGHYVRSETVGAS